MPTITAVTAHDVRFPTSLTMDGSDAMNKDGDYSAAYIVLHTDDPELSGYGFTFTIGRGKREQKFGDYDAALAALQKLRTPAWLRPTASGTWTTVTAARWTRLDRAELKRLAKNA